MTVKHFFPVEVEGEDYNLLYHAPSSKIARVPKHADMEKMSDEVIYQTFEKLKEVSITPKHREYGKGSIGITFMSSRTCNLSCVYCFAGEGEYGDSEVKSKYISSDLYLDSVKAIDEMYPEGIKSISFFGGEPLLYFKEIESFVPGFEQYFISRGREVPYIGISTNGSLLTNKKLEFIKQHNIKIVMSLDGPKEINDIARIVQKEGASIYDTVIKAIEKTKSHGVSFSIQMTINQNHIKQYKPGLAAEWLEIMEKYETENLAIVVVETDHADLQIKDKAHLEVLDQMVREITRYYINKLFEENPVIRAKGMIAALIQLAKGKYVDSCSAGHSVFVDTDGGIYPCHMFCNDDQFLLGNVRDGGMDREKVNVQANIDRMDGDRCKVCIAQSVCSFWCKGIQYLSTGDMYEVLDSRCVFQIANVEECLKALANLKKGTDVYTRFWNNVANANKQAQ
ncbi:radical SAM/SPASM domain-containing protein [Paenibacillus pseudetheri]|uniref:GTP 3',8-cyclase n=1 Tax=Paenibacillus pseudetheri TaxID=2897682 RepID=A0ABN8FKS4_9BACL|nr:radical SAM protein [Paenibacillus pseudetheri]CAH1058182.1 GTP 3',8-cyclase [Paenibacillus pseudetheri]